MAYYVKFVRGTQDAYNALVHKNSDTLYFITEADEADGKLYLGETLIAQGSQNEVLAINELSDVDISTVIDGHILTWDSEAKDSDGNTIGRWVNKSYSDIIGYPKLDTETGGYTNGLVPPSTSQEVAGNYFLSANGTWKQVITSGSGDSAGTVVQTKVYEVDATVDENHETKIAEKVGLDTLNTGDIAIVRVPILPDSNTEDDIDDGNYQYTAYVYKDGWKAMDGNYNASNVYFDEDITYTANIGAVELADGASSGTFSAKGKSLEEVLKSIMALIKEPEIKEPIYTMSVSRTTDTGNLELGSKIKTFTWSGTYTDGTYEYGYVGSDKIGTKANANCTASYKVSCDKEGSASGDTEDGTWTLTTPITIDSESSKIYGTITNICTYSDSSRVPVNNLGEATEGQIVSASTTPTQEKTISLTGYREGYFYGSSTEALGAKDLTSAIIRGLNKSKAKYSKGSKTYTIPVGAATVIFACPKTSTGVTDVLNTTVNANMNDAFGISSPTVVSVEGANGYEAVDYNVWFYTPATPYGSTAALTITLG